MDKKKGIMSVSANGARAFTMYRCAMTGRLFHSSYCSASPLLFRYPETHLVIFCLVSLSNVRTLDEHIGELPHYCECVNFPTLIPCIVLSCKHLPDSRFISRRAVSLGSCDCYTALVTVNNMGLTFDVGFYACRTTIDGSRTH